MFIGSYKIQNNQEEVNNIKMKIREIVYSKQFTYNAETIFKDFFGLDLTKEEICSYIYAELEAIHFAGYEEKFKINQELE